MWKIEKVRVVEQRLPLVCYSVFNWMAFAVRFRRVSVVLCDPKLTLLNNTRRVENEQNLIN